MGDTKVASIGQWWTSTRRGSPWRSFYAQKKTSWWEPQMILWAWMAPNTIQILHGHICFTSRKTTIEQTKLHYQTSPSGCYPPKPHTLASQLLCKPTNKFGCSIFFLYVLFNQLNYNSLMLFYYFKTFTFYVTLHAYLLAFIFHVS